MILLSGLEVDFENMFLDVKCNFDFQDSKRFEVPSKMPPVISLLLTL